MDHNWAESERTVELAPISSSPRLMAPDGLALKNVHGESLLRRLGRGVAKPFLAVGDAQRLAEHVSYVQQPVIAGLRIAVTGIHGGAGKSTIAALLAVAFARYRQDRVLALDLDPEFGSLPFRLGVSGGRSLRDLARAGLGTAPFEELEPYLARLGERLWTLTGSPGWRRGSDGDAAVVYGSAGLPLSRFFGVTVIDCGGGLRSDLHRAILASAHAQVFVTPATALGAASASRALTWLQAAGFSDLVGRTLVVFTERTPHGGSPVNIAHVRASLSKVGSDAFLFGFDRHLAVETIVDSRHLGHSARVTTTAIAAASIDRALLTPPSPPEESLHRPAGKHGSPQA
ncbi:nucleotide-binding protein [Actinomadura montaniterrae]|uniref:CobQ/CobB/MinD/ParA nucleotide binding domain-containing protein n=1 Tax=Actinomadura montaniterrae TaxID=1803903 RepID=A0A6L3WA98_9ACTN|nr:cellulose synthase operon protein YhjQ/BcsQ [Actinomadura montaniterrae]KAB2388830.1 hypothetical protein F9B16_02635 [Actinomadura montaniterrae]